MPAAYCLTAEFSAHRLWAGALLAVAILTDFLDGYVARRLHQVSELGKIIDPLADKIAVAVVAILLVSTGDVPLWYVLVVIVRDLLILVGGMIIRKEKKIIVQSNWPGKIAVTVIAVYLLLSVMQLEGIAAVKEFAFWASLVLMLLSLVVYAQRLFIGRTVETS
jgi:CDP-diacylglycerol--glycerol-3-phosphate 3-phosphatidyltransferase